MASEVLKHLWISFYLEPTLKTHALEQKKKNARLTSLLLSSIHKIESEIKRLLISSNSLSDSSTPIQASSDDCSAEVTNGEDGAGLVDVPTSAVSRVRISEPRRSRICSIPARAIQLEWSSNLKTDNLCTAF